MTAYGHDRVDERVAAQTAAVAATHPVRERGADERGATGDHQRVGDNAATVAIHGPVVAVTPIVAFTPDVAVTLLSFGTESGVGFGVYVEEEEVPP